ncbi:MAG: aminoacyl-tRNA hydrolase [Proteobacteria bacterium]|nr:aminoacyl-tRNA hydrolase [Pseudomonadota bacterium]
MAIQLIVGLGNPGPDYAKTRHNVGFWFVEMLCEQQRAAFAPEPKFKSLMTQISIDGHTCRVLQPVTYMNRSGEAIQAVLNFFKLKPDEMLVIHDELDLPCGSARLKFDGGHGGHNGLRDIISRLGTNQFYRLRLGISHPGSKEEVLNYVLHKPSLSDKQKILEAIDKSMSVLSDVVAGKIDKAMNHLHTIAK